jgi:hypothetical protein
MGSIRPRHEVSAESGVFTGMGSAAVLSLPAITSAQVMALRGLRVAARTPVTRETEARTAG